MTYPHDRDAVPQFFRPDRFSKPEDPAAVAEREVAARQAEAARIEKVLAGYVDSRAGADPGEVAAAVQAAPGWWRTASGVVRVTAVVELMVRPVERGPGVVVWAGLAGGGVVRLEVGPFRSPVFAERVVGALVASLV